MKAFRLSIAGGILALSAVALPAQAVVSLLTNAAGDAPLCELTDVSAMSDGSMVYAHDCIGTLQGEPGLGNKIEQEVNSKNADDSRPGNQVVAAPSFPQTVDDVYRSRGGDPWNPGAFGTDTWALKAKSDETIENPVDLGFKVELDDTSSDPVLWNWSVNALTPLNGDWVILVKQEQQNVLYLLKGLVATIEGTINLRAVRNEQFSHVSLLHGRSNGNGKVPAPATGVLLGLGLALLGLVRKRTAIGR